MASATDVLTVREAGPSDVPTLVRVINAAFVVERFFIDRDRTDAEGVRRLMRTGRFLIASNRADAPIACVYVEQRGERGYFGLLSVDPPQQKRGYARQLIGEVERCFRDQGCAAVDIRVVNLRTELPPFYRALGYVEQGTQMFEDPRASQPCHFILMSKALL